MRKLATLLAVSMLFCMTALAQTRTVSGQIKNDKGENRRSLYGYNDTVSTSILSKDQIDQAKAEVLNLKKQKQKLNDEILELNIRTEIPLSDEVVATLQAEGLI